MGINTKTTNLDLFQRQNHSSLSSFTEHFDRFKRKITSESNSLIQLQHLKETSAVHQYHSQIRVWDNFRSGAFWGVLGPAGLGLGLAI